MTRTTGVVATAFAAAWTLACNPSTDAPSGGDAGRDDDGGMVVRDDAGRRIDPDSGRVIPEVDSSTDSSTGTRDSGGPAEPACESSSIEDLPSDPSVSETFDNTGLGSEVEPPSTCAGVCSGTGAPDRTFRYTSPGDGMVTISTANPGTDEEVNTILSVFDTCDADGQLLACNDNATDVASRVVRPVANGETIIIVVDVCETDDLGNIELTVDLAEGSTAATGSDSCGSPAPLELTDVGGGVRVGRGEGDTSTASNGMDVATFCGSADGAPDHYYSFTLTEQEALDGRGSLRVEVTPLDADFDPLIYAFDAADCADPNLERCGDNRGPGEMEFLNTAFISGGTYVIAVEGVDGTSGAYELVARVGE